MAHWRLTLGLPLLAIPTPAPAQSGDPGWSGFYIAADLGLASGRLRASGTDTVTQLTLIDPPGALQPFTVVPGTTVTYAGADTQTTFVYGGAAGFLLPSGSWLFGLEGDGHGPRDSGSVVATVAKPATALEPGGTFTVARSARIDWDWSVRGRVGYTWGPAMIYIAGGVTGARARLRGADTYLVPTGQAGGGSQFVPPTIGPITISNDQRATFTGWTAGAGGEHRVAPHISIGLDGRFSDYGNRSVTFSGCSPNAIGQGLCPGTTITGAGTITFPAGTNPATISNPANFYPGASPGITRVSLNEWRLTARVVFHF